MGASQTIQINIERLQYLTIITEETPTNNDNKLFKKISVICQMQGVKCESISQSLQTRLDINLAIKSTLENFNSL